MIIQKVHRLGKLEGISQKGELMNGGAVDREVGGGLDVWKGKREKQGV